MRAGGVPAERLEIPPAPTEPPDVEALTRLAASSASRSSARPASRADPQNSRAGSAATGRPSSSRRNRLRSSPPA